VADNWRPLLAIADAAGGEWPSLARQAAAGAVMRSTEDSIAIELLADIKLIFEEKGVDRLPSSELTESLGQIEGHPWAEWGRSGRPITQNALARQLKKFRTAGGLPIMPETIRIGDRTPKGYLLSQFEDVFTRYSPKTAFPTATPQQAHSHGPFFDFQTATPGIDVAVGKCEKPLSHGPCCRVAVGNPSAAEATLVEAAPALSGPSAHTCAQCGLDDGEAEPHPVGDRLVWLHKECRRFYARDSGR
jgi:hypothetical protein